MTEKIEKYILPTGKADIERLKILNEVYGKYSRNTFDKINLKQGQKVAIFGCGTGEGIDYIHQKIGNEGQILCIDLSPEQIEVAKENLAKKSIHNVEYKIGDIGDIKGNESYDLAYCRFVLIHVDNPRKAIENMLSFVKSGGYIACDEFSVNWKYCYPEFDAYEKMREISLRANQHFKRDNRYGEKLYHEMLNFDVDPIEFQCNVPIFNTARKKDLMIKSWEAISNHSDIKKIATDEEFKMIIAELKSYRNDTSIYQSSGAMFQYIGRKI